MIEISLVTVTKNRAVFLEQLRKLIASQYYPMDKVEWIIVDDSDEDNSEAFSNVEGITVNYFYKKEGWGTLAEKRDWANSQCQGEYIIVMDDDDYYPPTRIAQAMWYFRQPNKPQLLGLTMYFGYFTSSQKIYRFGPYGNNHSTAACMAYTREYARTHSFGKGDYGEESNFTNGWKEPIVQLEPSHHCLVCLCHDSNTISKDLLLKPEYGQLGRSIVETGLNLAHVVAYRSDLDFYLGLTYQDKELSEASQDLKNKLDGMLIDSRIRVLGDAKNQRGQRGQRGQRKNRKNRKSQSIK